MRTLLTAMAFAAFAQHAQAQSDNEALAKQLSNPIASLISVPFQFNYNQGYGSEDGDQVLLNIQPVVPISLNDDWNVISRTILPVVWQNDVAGPSGSQFGLGDTLQSAWLSPAAPLDTAVGDVTWGLGAAVAIPTATDTLLGSGKLSIGPTAIVLTQDGPWTYGALVNHVWSVVGPSGRDDVNSSFLQPFLAYTTPSAWTFALNSESTYDWSANDWSVPVNATVSKLVDIGSQKVQLQGGVRYWATTPDAGPEGFGARLQATLLFPR